MTQAPARLRAEVIQDFATACFVSVGMGQDDATLVADTLRAAEVRGVTSHDLIRRAAYLGNIEGGAVNRVARPILVSDGPTAAVVDGQRAMGQVVSKLGMETTIERASSHGIAAAACRTSRHFGAGAFWARLLARTATARGSRPVAEGITITSELAPELEKAARLTGVEVPL